MDVDTKKSRVYQVVKLVNGDEGELEKMRRQYLLLVDIQLR